MGDHAHLWLRPVHKRQALGLPRFAPVPPWTGSRLLVWLRTWSRLEMCQARNGKKREWERNGKGTRSFLSRSSIFGHPFFPVSGQNHEKRVKKEEERPKNGWKDVERQRTAVLRRSRFSNLARFHFLYRLKPIFFPFQPRFYPFFPVLAPFFSHSCPVLILLSYHI